MSNSPETLDEVVTALAREISSGRADIVSLMLAANLNPKTDFRGGKWRDRDFSGLDLTNCNFRGSDLRRAKFDGAQLAGAFFQGAEITASNIIKAPDWRKAQYDEEQWLALTRVSLASLPIDERLVSIENLDGLSEREWVALIKDEVKREHGKAYLNARKILDLMDKHFEPPSRFAYSALISEADEFSAQREFDRFCAAHGVVDGALIATVIDRLSDFNKALAFIDDASARGCVLNEHAFNSAFKIAIRQADGDRATIDAAISELQSRGMTFGQIGLNILLSISKRASEAIAIFERMDADGHAIRAYDINQALRILPTDEIDAVIDFAKRRDIEFDGIGFNLLIGKQPSAFDAVPWLDQMIASGTKPDLFTLRSMLRCACSPVDAAIGLTFLQRRGFDVYRREAISGLAELTHDRSVIEWVTKMWENMDPPKDAMKKLFDRIFKNEPQYLFFWSLVR